MCVSSVARNPLLLHVNQDDIMSYVSQKCCTIESVPPSQLHGLPQSPRRDHYSLTVRGKEKSHLKALSGQVIYVTLMMKAVTQAGGPPPTLC